jgi:hypothetical protein
MAFRFAARLGLRGRSLQRRSLCDFPGDNGDFARQALGRYDGTAMIRPMRLLILLLIVPALAGAQVQSVSEELAAFQSGMAASEWTARHPHDRLERLSPAAEHVEVAGTWCVRAQSSFEEGGAELVRTAYFFMPESRLLTLPNDDGPHPELALECRLGAIFITSRSGFVSLEREAPRVADDLTRRFGRRQPFSTSTAQQPVLVGSAFWKASEWKSGEARIIFGTDPTHHKLVAVAVSNVAASGESGDFDSRGRLIRHQADLCRKFLSQTGLPDTALGEMRSLLAYSERKRLAGSKDQPPAALMSLSKWLEQAAGLPPERRAAALYVADFVLDANLDLAMPHPGSYQKADLDAELATLRSMFSRFGARFEYSPLGASVEYDHDWVEEALHLAPASAPGEAAFLFLMDRGFDPTCCCAGGEYQFRKVIEEGARRLREYPRAASRSQVLLAMGDAYRDIIALAHGALADYANAVEFRPEMQQAHASALKYYRAAIAASPGSETSAEAKVKAWMLIAGLTPADTRFVCVYD